MSADSIIILYSISRNKFILVRQKCPKIKNSIQIVKNKDGMKDIQISFFFITMAFYLNIICRGPKHRGKPIAVFFCDVKLSLTFSMHNAK